jgi:hypothetical protein
VQKTATHIFELQASGYQASVSQFCKAQTVKNMASIFNLTSFVTTAGGNRATTAELWALCTTRDSWLQDIDSRGALFAPRVRRD